MDDQSVGVVAVQPVGVDQGRDEGLGSAGIREPESLLEAFELQQVRRGLHHHASSSVERVLSQGPKVEDGTLQGAFQIEGRLRCVPGMVAALTVMGPAVDTE
jgi:hypothetical protein